ncbi:GNAT family N-acetyltransferase [Legionella sp. CNM-4043-24]|uniref:GNAT family N-acetyltransferase n=1 Tax=Legionella sp. CNM-4043-24 TaxID=3421646 RepID=UPI00403B1C71
MFIIIQAKSSFIGEIFSMIMALARHESIEDRIKISESQLRELLFHPQPRHFVGMALVNDKLAGLVMYNYTHHNICVNLTPGIYIENLYVSLEFRKQGIGRALFEYVATKAKEQNCSRIEWWVSTANREASYFYEKMEATTLSNWNLYKCDRDGIDRLLNQGEINETIGSQ